MQRPTLTGRPATTMNKPGPACARRPAPRWRSRAPPNSTDQDRPGARPRRRLARRARGRVPLHPRPVRLRQDHAALVDGRAARADARRDHASTARPITRPHPEIAMIFQDANLLPWRTLEKNIQLPFELKRIAAGPGAHRNSLLERVGLDRLRQQISARAVRRHAAARLDRAQPRRRSVGAPDGRAVRRARRLHARRDEPAHPGDLDGDAARRSPSSRIRSPRRSSSPTASW